MPANHDKRIPNFTSINMARNVHFRVSKFPSDYNKHALPRLQIPNLQTPKLRPPSTSSSERHRIASRSSDTSRRATLRRSLAKRRTRAASRRRTTAATRRRTATTTHRRRSATSHRNRRTTTTAAARPRRTLTERHLHLKKRRTLNTS